MKTAGLVGGLGPESTIEYYRQLVAQYRVRQANGDAPQLLIASLDVRKLLSLIGDGALQEVTDYLSRAVDGLARAGADFAAIAANTPHIVFDEVADVSPIPLISIVQATCDAAAALGLHRLGLLSTRFTTENGFYARALAKHNIEVVVPPASERDYVHEKYVSELLRGVVRPETRGGLLKVIARMRAATGIDGVILGGTELSLIFPDDRGVGLPLLDTTRIHVNRIVTTLMEGLDRKPSM
jgi:aspartate racemase